MTYEKALQSVNPQKALELLKLETTQSGAYIYFPCPDCKGRAVVKAYGDKKGLTYCTACKKSGNLIKLTEQLLKMDTDGAKRFLQKASQTQERITTELTLSYDLQYQDFMKELGITEEAASRLEIGVPKGKTMLAGCLTFTVRDENGLKVAYYGIRLKDKKPVFHKSFNPEHFLWNICFNDAYEGEVILTTDMVQCARYNAEGKVSVSNFGLPYLSPYQLEMLSKINYLVFEVPEPFKREFALTAAEKLDTFYRFSRAA